MNPEVSICISRYAKPELNSMLVSVDFRKILKQKSLHIGLWYNIDKFDYLNHHFCQILHAKVDVVIMQSDR